MGDGKLVCGHIADRVGILRTVVSTEIAPIASIAVVILSPLPGTLAVLPFLGIALNGTSSVLYGTVGDFLSSHRQALKIALTQDAGDPATVAALGFFSNVDHP